MGLADAKNIIEIVEGIGAIILIFTWAISLWCCDYSKKRSLLKSLYIMSSLLFLIFGIICCIFKAVNLFFII